MCVSIYALSVCFVLQDTARNFLCGSVADKKKYEIFMKVRACVCVCMFHYGVRGGWVRDRVSKQLNEGGSCRHHISGGLCMLCRRYP